MVKLDPDALYHRTLGAGSIPYEDYQARTDVFEKAAKETGTTIGKAYTIKNRKLVPILYVLKKDQEFKTYATSWEILHSRLPFGSGSGKADPVVDENMTIVGHYGWFESSSIFLPPNTIGVAKKTVWMPADANGHPRTPAEQLLRVNPATAAGAATPSAGRMQKTVPKDFGDLISGGTQIYADDYQRSYLKRGYVAWNSPLTSYRIITDPEGRAICFMERWNPDGVEASWVTPLDIISIVKIVVLAGRALGSLAVRMVARKAASRALQNATEELASDAVRELTGGAARGCGDDLHRADDRECRRMVCSHGLPRHVPAAICYLLRPASRCAPRCRARRGAIVTAHFKHLVREKMECAERRGASWRSGLRLL
jgi:hypothetical protein